MTLETEFAEVLDTIATSLGIAAERIFGIVVGAQAAMGIIDVAAATLTFGAAYITWRTVRNECIKQWQDEDGTWGDHEDNEIRAGLYPIIGAMIVFVAMWLFTYWMGTAILHIVCPEYTAMTEIVKWIR